MPTEYFLGPSFGSLIKRYLLLTGLRFAWYYINGYGFELAWVSTPYPWAFFSFEASELMWSFDLALSALQLGVTFGFMRLVLLHFWPVWAVKLKLVAEQGDVRPTVSRHRSHSWLITAVFLSGLVTLTTCLIGWLIMGRSEGIPFDDYVNYMGQIPLLVGLGLSLLGFLFGGNYIARAAGDVSTSFRVVIVPEDHWLHLRVKKYAEQLGLPAPKVGITDVTNAFAMGTGHADATVVIGKPLFALDADELDAIIGHELGHVLHHDVKRMQFAEGFQQMLVKVTNAATVILGLLAAHAAQNSRNSRQTNAFNAQSGKQLAHVAGNLTRVTLFVGSELVVKGISRNREFHADAVGAQVTSPDAMIRALKRIHGVAVQPSPEERQYGYLMFRGAGFGALFSTHPTLNARVSALEARTNLHGLTETARQKAILHDETQASLTISRQLEEGVASALAESPESEVTPSPVVFPLATNVSTREPWDAVNAKVSAWLKRVSIKPVIIGLVAVLAIFALAPAVVSYYRLDQKVEDGKAAAATFAAASWNWVASQSQAAKEAVVGPYGPTADQLRIRQLEAAVAQLRSEQVAQPVTNSGETENLRNSVQYLRNEVARLHDDIRDRDQKISSLQAENIPQRLVELQASLALKTTDADTERNKRIDLEGQLRTLQLELQQTKSPDLATALPDVHEEPEPTPSIPVFGAIAASLAGVVVLPDIDFASARDANAGALATCRQFAGGFGCQIKMNFSNTCAAIARVSPGGKNTDWHASTGSTIENAEQLAMSNCERTTGRQCQITRSTCPR